MLASLFLALSLATLPVGWNYNVTECINSSGVPVRSIHEGDRIAILGSGFGANGYSGRLVVAGAWAPVLAWSDTRIDAQAGHVPYGMAAAFAPIVLIATDGTHCLSPFRVELVSGTVRAAPGAPRSKGPSKQQRSLPGGFLRFYRGL